MSHLFQVGAGSGGMTVLDLVCRDPRITELTLIEPDTYEPHNVARHLFPPSAVESKKANLAAKWLKERRPDLKMQLFIIKLEMPMFAAKIEAAAQAWTP